MSIKNKEFIAVEFRGSVKNGEIFDSNLKEDLEALHRGHDHPIEVKPFVFVLGYGMFLKAIEEFLIGKEIGKNYEIELEPSQAFGPRNATLVQTVPLKVFHEQRINPVAGATLNFDGRIGKILTVSGGRVMVDFNHSLAGKHVVYKIKPVKEVTDINEKVNALNEFFFRRDFKFEIKEKKLTMDVDKPLVKFVEMFREQYKEILGLDLEIKEVEARKEEPSHNHHH